MFHRTVAVTALLALLTVARPATAQEFTIDPYHHTFYFSIGHMDNTSRIFGRFNDVKGTVQVGETPSFDITIDVASIDTGVAKRDEHLRTADFFDVKQFPTITFKSTKVERGEDGLLKVTGDLTLHGVTRSVTMPVSQVGPREIGGGQRAGFATRLTINRSDYGMNFMIGPVSDDVDLMIEFEVVPPKKSE